MSFRLKDSHILVLAGAATPALVPALVLDPSVYHFSMFKGRVLSSSVLHFLFVLNTLC